MNIIVPNKVLFRCWHAIENAKNQLAIRTTLGRQQEFQEESYLEANKYYKRVKVLVAVCFLVNDNIQTTEQDTDIGI